MQNTFTIMLPADIEQALQEATQEEGLKPDDLIRQALQDFLFLRKFRTLRARMLTQYTDEEIFEIVS